MHTVLEEIDALTVPTIELLNKIDATDDPTPTLLAPGKGSEAPLQVRLSAREGHGFGLLEQAIAEILGASLRVQVRLGPEQGRMRARCYEQGWVEAERIAPDGGAVLDLYLPRDAAERLTREGVVLVWSETSERAANPSPGFEAPEEGRDDQHALEEDRGWSVAAHKGRT